MCRKVQIFISSLLFFFSISTAISQNIINWINVDPAVHIALTNFEAPLAIEVKIPKGETSVNLKVFFPEGINYSRIEVPQQEGTLVKVEKTTDSTINQPIFIVTTNSDSPVKLLVYRKFTNQIKTEVNYSDVVEAIVGGEVVEKRVSAFYKLKSPKLEIVTEPIEVGKKGENRRGFSVKNLGEGAIKEFYLSVQYPDNIKNKALYYKKNGEDHLLVPESTVPKGLANKGRYFYKVNADVLKKENNIQVSFSEIYEITNCFSVIPIQYQVYWGSDLTTEGLFEASKITEKIVSNYTVSNLLSYQEGKIRGETTDEVLYKGEIRINTIDKTIQTGEKSYFKVQLPVGITPVFSLGDLKSVVPLSQNVTEYTFLLPQGKKKKDSFDYTLKLQTNKKLTFVPSSKMVYYTTEESGRETCTATPFYTSIKKEITIPIEETLLHPIKLQTTNDTFSHTTTTQTIVLGNILNNDSYNSQSVTTASVTISTTTTLTNFPYIAIATGEVLLPAHTPAGTYTLTYSVCAKTAPYNCSGVATVTVIVSPSPIKLRTTNDTFSHTTTTQTIVLGNVLTNDSYNSQSVTTASVTISTTTTLTNVPYIATATGEVFLPAHIPAGTYTLTYSLCAKSAPYNCSGVATVTVIVSPSPIKLRTTNDTFSHTTTTQTIVLGNVLTNDSYNTQSVTTASVTISTTTTLTNVPYIAIATGEVFLPVHTPAGTYTLSYSLCAKTAPYNCSEVATVIVKVTPSPINLQTTDDIFSHTTTTQTIVLGNILTNDSYNSQSVTTASVTINTTTPLTNTPYIATATGEVFLPAHTPAGTYTLTYSLCAKTAPYNCSGVATVTVIVSPSPINLQTTDDIFSHTTTTQTIVLGNILTNDSYNSQSVTTASVTINTTTPLTNTPYIATATGEVFLPAHTTAGTYTLTYRLCAKLAPYNCSGVATVTVKVNPSPIKLQTTDDTFSHTTTTQTIVLGNILTNDSYNTQSVTTASVTISTTTALTNTPYIAIATGEVFLPAHTPAGTYTLTYSLCAKSAPYNCSEVATVTVKVNPSPIKLQTTDDTFSHTTTTQTIFLGNILTNDSYNTQSVTTASVTISTTTALTNFPYIATATGEVFLPAHTPAGTYTLTYSLCAKSAPYNCSEVATVTVIVNPSPIKLQTTDDTFSHTTATQTIVLGNILNNDRYNTQSVTTESVTISTTTALTNSPYIATQTGEVFLPAHTPAGTYTLTYTLCTKSAPYNCSEVATVTVSVIKPLVIARDDTYTVTIGTTTITESIYSNDSIGEQIPNAYLVNFQSIGGSKDSDNFYVLSVNLAGNVLIPQGMPTGTYTLQYRICDVKDSHNCATATITVMVTEIPTPLIIARDDTYTVTIGTTTITESVYTNDSIGEQTPNASLVNFQVIGGSKDSDNFYVLSVNLAGNVLIPQGTPIGTYTLEYRICDINHQSNCDTAIVKVSITSPPVPPSTLVVTPDKFTYTGNSIVGNILDNDTIDDNPIELPNDDINIEAEEPTDTAPYIETSTGNVIVPTHTPAGTYTLNYELCIENLTICDATTVEVIVPDNPTPPAPPKPQEDETATPINVLITYNAISLNDDNKNDYFHIESIEKYPDNIVRIYNKEGLKVFEVTGYDNKNQSFKGLTQGEVAVKEFLELPTGTYFYFIEYTDENHQLQRKIGWLYLRK
ncbi:gliding motility-associated C-terminal domain-containing protein [Capnocytophaga sputigena]|uniref:gliding motility-associated C-terminal domain-containing protein n=1 Tax=Capnocytophaga sputigena TaxID=1019 RepID=UPI0028D8C67B|nr:gliding motility-associated C-terminal domain-containing protein [Capnocytophaga sputigena]